MIWSFLSKRMSSWVVTGADLAKHLTLHVVDLAKHLTLHVVCP